MSRQPTHKHSILLFYLGKKKMCGSGYIAKKIKVGRSEKLLFFYYNQWLSFLINTGYMFIYVPNNVRFEKEWVWYSIKFVPWYEHSFLFTNIENCENNE